MLVPERETCPQALYSVYWVDKRFQGQGYGGDLLFDCLVRIDQAAEALGIAVILLDVLDCGDSVQVDRRKRLYEGYGFKPLAAQPLRLFLPLATARDLIRGC